MFSFASVFRILLAALVILPFADATPQTSPAPAQASPSTAPARDVTGRWDLRVEMGADRTSRGELWLFPRGEEFTGTVSMQGAPNTLPVRTLTMILAGLFFTSRPGRSFSQSSWSGKRMGATHRAWPGGLCVGQKSLVSSKHGPFAAQLCSNPRYPGRKDER